MHGKGIQTKAQFVLGFWHFQDQNRACLSGDRALTLRRADPTPSVEAGALAFPDTRQVAPSLPTLISLSMYPTRHFPPNQKFPTTRWTLVERACQAESPESELEALQNVCLSYWQPLYAWARQSSWSPEDAADLIQSFFERMLEKGFLAAADREKGRLRTFLLTCLKRHANDVRDKNHAARRDARKTVSLDFEWAEGRYHGQAAAGDSPDALYDRRWAHTLLHYTLEILEKEMINEGKGQTFAVLKNFLEFRPDLESSREEIAAQLGISEGALKSQIFRLRKRFHELLMAQVSITIGENENPKDELMALMASV